MDLQQRFSFDSHEKVRRHDDFLGVPGLTYWPDFLSPEEQGNALEEVDQREWRSDLSRRVQHYGYRYDYKSRTVLPSMFLGELPEFARQIAKRLRDLKLMNEVPDQVIINEYRPGQGITPHVDCKPCFGDRIATISLGSVYTMDLMDTESDETRNVRLELGSCLVFSHDARYRWKHAIKARKSDNGVTRGRRVSMTFRTVIVASEESQHQIQNG